MARSDLSHDVNHPFITEYINGLPEADIASWGEVDSLMPRWVDYGDDFTAYSTDYRAWAENYYYPSIQSCIDAFGQIHPDHRIELRALGEGITLGLDRRLKEKQG